MGGPQRTKPVAVVTGAPQGLGLALAAAVAHEGFALVVDARRADRLGVAVERLARLTDVVGIAGDVTDPTHRDALAATAARLGAVHVLVNNASTLGASPLPSLHDIGVDVLHRIFDVNVVAPIALVQRLDAQLVDGATVVNITSDAAVEAYPG